MPRQHIERELQHDLGRARRPRSLALHIVQPLEEAAHIEQQPGEFRPGLIYRLNAISSRIPLIVDVALDRGAILTPISTITSALTASFGVSDSALSRVLSGEITPVGRLPIALPMAMNDVRTVAPDTGLAADKCLYPAGHKAPL